VPQKRKKPLQQIKKVAIKMAVTKKHAGHVAVLRLAEFVVTCAPVWQTIV
jgi:hypothetical protein